MPTHEEIELELLKIYDDYAHLFMLVKIDRLKFCEWLDAFDFNGIRRVRTWMVQKVFNVLLQSNIIWHGHAASSWDTMRKLTPHNVDVLKLRQHEYKIKELWQNRPKPPRRG